jgi:dTDP-4-amino-4,6-dideoxygalactose transaminase
MLESAPVTQQSITGTNRPGRSPRKFLSVPLLDLKRQYESLREPILAAIEGVCRSQQFILGAETEALEREVAAFTGSAASVACASGTDALWLSLLALNIRPGDAVITTPFSFFASASAIARVGGRPVFADIDPHTFNLNPLKVSTLLQSQSSYKIKAILPVHLYGQCADMGAFQELAHRYRIPVLEDAAQAIGATWQSRAAGSMGAAAAFSFYPTKNLSAYGDAGLVTTTSMQMAEHMRRLRNHGSAQRYFHDEFGGNSRMDAVQAAVLRVKLPHLPKWNAERRERAANYDQLFLEAGLAARSGKAPIRLPARQAQAGHIFHQYVIRAERRDELRRFLTDRNIGTEIYYPLPLHLQTCFTYLGYVKGDFPEAELAAGEVLALPMFPELTPDEQGWVVENIAEFYS